MTTPAQPTLPLAMPAPARRHHMLCDTWKGARGCTCDKPIHANSLLDLDRADYQPHADDDTDYWESGGCQTCDGEGIIVTCIDDLCRGAGYCMHGDGEHACPECGGL